MGLIKKYFGLIDYLLSKKVSATGLALFRMAYSFVLLCEISQIIYFRNLIYDKIPFIEPAEINFLPGLVVWAISVFFILIGFQTRKAALVNYVLSLVFIGTIKSYEYHVFYTYMGVNFLFLFLDISRNHSLDRLTTKLKYSSAHYTYEPSANTSAFNYFIPIAVSLGFVYFDSIFFKFASYNWLNGLGMWLPASLSIATHVDVTPFLNAKWLSLGLGILTVIFEFIFLFTFFIKQFRVPLLIVGAGLHLGITIIFPIPWFGLAALAVYLLMVPLGLWSLLGRIYKKKKSILTVFYDKNCPLCNRTRISFQHFDYRDIIEWKTVDDVTNYEALKYKPKDDLLNSIHSINRKGKVFTGFDSYLQMLRLNPFFFILFLFLSMPGIYHFAQWVYGEIAMNRSRILCTDDNCGYVPPKTPEDSRNVKLLKNLTLYELKKIGLGVLFFLLIALQLNVTFHSKLIQQGLAETGISKTLIYHNVMSASKKIWGGAKIFFGITRHGVFMDGHFEGYNHILAIEAIFNDGSKQWLPIIKKDGTAGWYDYSFLWVKWTFRVMDNYVNQELLEKGVRDFATFWAIKNDHNIQDISFNIYVKRVDYPKKWEQDFLRKQKAKPWKLVGEGRWLNNKFELDIPEIESIQ